jgi:hypothetical protein
MVIDKPYFEEDPNNIFNLRGGPTGEANCKTVHARIGFEAS